MKIHSVERNGRTIICELKKRKNSRNLKMYIDSNGIVKVSLPYYTPYISAKNFVKKNLDWIEKKLDYFKLQKSRYYYLGKDIRLLKIYNANYKYFNYILSGSNLTIKTNDININEEQLYFEFLKERANDYIPKRVKEISKRYGFEYKDIKIKNLSSRWGSCSAKKNLSFNLKLMYFNYKVIDYVIIHELCHLKFMNHSAKFWKLVEKIMPEYKKYKLELNR